MNFFVTDFAPKINTNQQWDFDVVFTEQTNGQTFAETFQGNAGDITYAIQNVVTPIQTRQQQLNQLT